MLSWVARRGNLTSTVAALVMAAIEIAKAAPSVLSAAALAQAIVDRADTEYALPPSDPGRAGAKQIADAIVLLPFAEWTWLRGPALSAQDGAGATPPLPGPYRVSLESYLFVLQVA